MALKYKVGDKVRIKSLDWYNKNKDINGNIRYKHGNVYPIFFTKYMSRFCGETVTIKCVHTRSYHMNETGSCEFWTDEMIECKVEGEAKPNIIEEAKTYWDSIKDAWICPDGYTFKDENGNVINAQKIVLEKKKNKFPKTYEECCEILGCKANDFFTDFSYNNRDVEISDYEDKIDDLLQNFRKLRYCRDAYWKLYGEEMGLGKPWKPDWKNHNIKYVLFNQEGEIDSMNTSGPRNYILAFPTPEMRDAFKENFDPDIEICKELL